MTSPTESIQITEVSTTGTNSIDALLGGIKWGDALGLGASISYSFPYVNGASATWDDTYWTSTDNEPNYAASGFTTIQQASALAALQKWANVANLAFSKTTETSTNVGDIRFAFTFTPAIRDYWGYAYYPAEGEARGGDIWVNPDYSIDYQYNSWAFGSYNYLAMLHELGHALGLKHPFDAGVAADEAILPPDTESRQYTVMSYTAHPHSTFLEVTEIDGLYSWRYYDIQPEAPMLYDIAVMQHLYGANMAYNTGDDTYTFDPHTPFFMTIWDAGGTDTLSVSNFSKGCIIDLRAGNFSKITIESDPLPLNAQPITTATYDGTDNLAIAYGVTIENATGGSGDDSLIGNSANNSLFGGAGNDTLNGQSGIDTGVYSDKRSACTITKTTSGFTVSGGSSGTDTLSDIERLQFADIQMALDLDGAAGATARIIGAAFGEHYLTLAPGCVGAGLTLFDAGWSMAQVAELALDTDLFLQLAGSRDNAAVVSQLYKSVIGIAPSTSDLNTFLGMLSGGMSQAEFLVLAANTTENAQNINLLGLMQTGINFT
ncbi:MAG: M10 family metallopeptidase [Deltaproteobacteria bacterium]|nr:M10 family metallopeptidase [Deltaproteobacteria bacterium]